MKNKICVKCGKEYIPTGKRQKYCGNIKDKNSCAYSAKVEYRNSERYCQLKREQMKRYQEKNRDKISERARKRYSSNKKNGKFCKRLRLRFEVFKRDNFTCQYCGRKAPNVELQADHIIPDSKGGEYAKNNLITSCIDCNMGKGDVILNESK